MAGKVRNPKGCEENQHGHGGFLSGCGALVVGWLQAFGCLTVAGLAYPVSAIACVGHIAGQGEVIATDAIAAFKLGEGHGVMAERLVIQDALGATFSHAVAGVLVVKLTTLERSTAAAAVQTADGNSRTQVLHGFSFLATKRGLLPFRPCHRTRQLAVMLLLESPRDTRRPCAGLRGGTSCRGRSCRSHQGCP